MKTNSSNLLKISRKIFLSPIPILIISCFLLISCSSGVEKWRKWIDNNEGKELTDERMNYLIEEFNTPQDTIMKGDEKIFQYQGISSFHSPEFSKEETEKYIEDYNNQYDKLYNWLKESGKKQGLGSQFQTTSYNDNWELYKSKKNELWDEFKEIYYNRIGEDTRYSFNDLVQDHNRKNPNLSTSQSIDSITEIFNISDLNRIEFTSQSYLFRIEENIWYSEYYDLNNGKKDYLIDILEEVRVNQDGVIIRESSDGSFCISKIGKKKMRDYVKGDWVYNGGLDRVLGAIKFNEDGTYSMSNTMGVSKKGKWQITCYGGIYTTNSNLNYKVKSNGIKVGETLYTKP